MNNPQERCDARPKWTRHQGDILQNMDASTIKEYLSAWATGSHDISFYKKWSIFIELVTGVRINETFTDIQKYAVANTCSIKVERFAPK